MMNKWPLRSLITVLVITNSLFCTSAIASDTFIWIGGSIGEWTVAANWHAVDANQDGILPAIDGDVIIDGNVKVTLSAPTNYVVESVVLSGGANLTIAPGATLTTRKGGAPGSGGFRLDGESGNESTLTVNGTLNINTSTTNAPRDGLDINRYTSVTIGPMAVLSILNAGEYAIEISDDLTNSGSIIITSPVSGGIAASGGVDNSLITNNGSITMSGLNKAIELNSVISLVNNGTVTISALSESDLIINGGDFINNGTLGGSGTIETANLIHGAGSTIAPGTSPGKIIFNGDLDLSGVTLDIEIDGGSNAGIDYDQIKVNGTVNLDGATLNLDGSYSPIPSDVFTIITSAGVINGQFDTPIEGSTVTLNNSLLSIHYTSSDPNNLRVNFSGGCSCDGAPVPCDGIADNDGDGVCTHSDCDDNDPNVATQPGTICDDEDNTTLNDIIDTNCNCTGTPTACTGIGDADGDGVCA
ncbi:MAG: hypothetical protein KDD01_16175, partial [Phaeodactylibacter sp.]|nr:hypothetical protein [Phaeodactylibacter sp.]